MSTLVSRRNLLKGTGATVAGKSIAATFAGGGFLLGKPRTARAQIRSARQVGWNSPGLVADNFVYSNEFAQRVATTHPYDVIQSHYTGLLGRVGSLPELEAWHGAAVNYGWRAVTRGFVGSPEYLAVRPVIDPYAAMQGLYLGVLGRNAVFGELSAWTPDLATYEIVAEPVPSQIWDAFAILRDVYPDGQPHTLVYESDPYGRGAVTLAVASLATAAGMLFGGTAVLLQTGNGLLGNAIRTGALLTAVGGGFAVGAGLVAAGVGTYILAGLIPQILRVYYPSASTVNSPAYLNWGVVRNLDGSTIFNRPLDAWVPPMNYIGDWLHEDSHYGVDSPSGLSGWFLEF